MASGGCGVVTPARAVLAAALGVAVAPDALEPPLPPGSLAVRVQAETPN